MSETSTQKHTLKDRTPIALVTGAAAGIGKATALAYAQAGCDVVIADVKGELLQEVATQIEKMGRQALACVTDVADADSGAMSASSDAGAPGTGQGSDQGDSRRRGRRRRGRRGGRRGRGGPGGSEGNPSAGGSPDAGPSAPLSSPSS